MSKEAKSAESVKDSNKKKAFGTKSINPMKNVVGGMKGGLSSWWQNFKENLPKQLIKFGLILGGFIIVLIIISLSFSSKRGKCFEADTFDDGEFGYIINANGRNGKTEEEKSLEMDKNTYIHEETTQRMKKVNFNLKKDNKPIIIDIKDHWIPWFGDIDQNRSEEDINSSTPSKLVLCPMKKQVIPEFFSDNNPIMGSLKEENEFQYIDSYYSDFRFKEESATEIKKITTLRNPLLQEPCWLTGGLGLYMGFYGTSGKKQPGYFHHLQANQMVCNAYDFLPSNSTFLSNYSKIINLAENLNMNLVNLDGGKKYLLKDFIKENFSVKYFKNKDSIYQACFNNKITNKACSDSCTKEANAEFEKTEEVEKEKIFNNKLKEYNANNIGGVVKQDFLSVYKNYLDYESLNCLYAEKEKKLRECIYENKTKDIENLIDSNINYLPPIVNENGTTTPQTSPTKGAELNRLKVRYDFYIRTQKKHTSSEKIAFSEMELKLFKNWSYFKDVFDLISLEEEEEKEKEGETEEQKQERINTLKINKLKKYSDSLQPLKEDNTECQESNKVDEEINDTLSIGDLCYDEKNYEALVEALDSKTQAIVSEKFLSCITSKCSSSNNKLVILKNKISQSLSTCVDKYQKILKEIHTRNTEHINILTNRLAEDEIKQLKNFNLEVEGLMKNEDAIIEQCNKIEQLYFIDLDNELIQMADRRTVLQEQININQKLLKVNMDLIKNFAEDSSSINNFKAKNTFINGELVEIKKKYQNEINTYKIKYPGIEIDYNQYKSQQGTYFKNSIKTIREYSQLIDLENSVSYVKTEIAKIVEIAEKLVVGESIDGADPKDYNIVAIYNTLTEFKNDIDEFNADPIYIKDKPDEIKKTHIKQRIVQEKSENTIEKLPELENELLELSQKKNALLQENNFKTITEGMETDISSFFDEILSYLNSHINIIKNDTVPLLSVYLDNLKNFKEIDMSLKADVEDYYRYSLSNRYHIFKGSFNLSSTISGIYHSGRDKEAPYLEQIQDDIKLILNTYGKKENSDKIYTNTKNVETGDVLAFKNSFELSPMFSNLYKITNAIDNNCIYDFNTVGIEFSKYVMKGIDRTIRFADFINYGKDFFNLFFADQQFYGTKECNGVSGNNQKCQVLTFTNSICDNTGIGVPIKFSQSTDASIKKVFEQNALRGLKFPITKVEKSTDSKFSQKDINDEFSLFNLFTKDLDLGENSPIKTVIKNVDNANSDVKTNYTNSKCVNQNDQDLMACCIRTKEDEINKDIYIDKKPFLQNNKSENTVIYDMERHEQALIAANVKNIPQILVKAQNSFYNACYKETTIKKDNGEKGQIKEYLSFYRYSEKTKMFPILKTYNYNDNDDSYKGESYSLGEIPFFIILDKYYDDNQGSYNLNFKSGFSLSSSAFGGKLKNELLKIEYKLLGTSRPEQEKFDRTDGVVYHVYQRIITDSFRNLAKAILALFVIIKGYYIIFGLTQINIKELMILTLKIAFLFSILDKNGWNFYNKTFINFFINSTIGFIDLLYIIFYKIFDDQNNLQAFISNTNILAANGNELNLSKYFIFLDNLIETILSESFFARILSLIFYKMPFGIIFMIILVKSTISYLNSVITMVINYISILLQIAILLPLAPIFLLFMLFKQTFPYFKNWVSYLMSRCIELIAFFFVIFFSVSLINGQLNEVLNFKTCVDTVYSSSKNVKNAVFTESDLTGMQGRSVFISGLITMMSGLAMAIFGGVVFYIPVGLIESEVTLFEFMLRMLKLYFLLTMFGQINTTVTSVITQMFKFKIDPKDDRDKGGYRSNTAGQIGGQGGFLGALGNQTGLDSEGQGGGLLGSLGMGGVLRTPSVGGAMKVGKVAGTHMKNLATAALRTFGVGNGSLDALVERLDDSRRNNKAKRVRKKQAKQALLASYVGKAANLQDYADRRNRYTHNQWRLFKNMFTIGKKRFSKEERDAIKSMNAEHRKYTKVLAKTLNQTLGLGIFQIKRQLKTLSKPEALKLKQEVAQKSAEEKLKKLDQDRINMENNKYKFEFLDNKSGKEGKVIKSMVATNDAGENIIVKMVNGQMVISINNDTYTLNKDGIFVNSAGVALDLFNMDNVKVAKNLIDYGRRFIEAKRVGINTLNTTSEVKHFIKQGSRRIRLNKTEQTLNKAVDNLVQNAKDNDDKAFKLVKTEHSLNNAIENLAGNHTNKKLKLNKTEYDFEIHTNDKRLHYDNNNLLIDENGAQLNLNNQENIDLIREVNKNLVIEQLAAENDNYKSKDIFSDYQPKDIENKIGNLIDNNTELVASKTAGLEFVEKQEQLALEQGQVGLDVQYNMIMKGDITEMTITAGMENFKISSNGKDFSISSDIGNFTLNSEGQYIDENQQPMSENELNTLKVMEKMTKMSEKFLDYQKMLLTKLEEENANPKIIKLKKEEIEKQSESIKKSENRQKRLKSENENN